MKHSARISLAAGIAALLLLASCANGTQESAPAESAAPASVSNAASDADFPSVSEEAPAPLSPAEDPETPDAGSDEAPNDAEDKSPAEVPEETPDETPDETPAPPAEEEPAPEEKPAAPTPEEALKIAMGYVGQPAADLIAVIGEPGDKDYAPSCMGPGEDGNLYYDGFTVYTYLEDGEETIQDVE